ncbi:MAG: Trm112 family protein [Candidatus Marinimicrobia bacterium]|nr:Trm112 family protein [Candidatus Neomarinimicrobiota bacterium]
MGLSRELLDILVCPQCKGELEYRPSPEQLLCRVCRLVYGVQENIPILLVDQAHTLETGQ